MLKVFSRNTEEAPLQLNGDIIRQIADRVSAVGIEITDISADAGTINRVVKEQAQVCNGLSDAIHDLNNSNAAIVRSAADTRDTAVAASTEISGSQQTVANAVRDISLFTTDVQQIRQQLGGVGEALEELKKVTAGIQAITRQTHLLSLNAGIECARAGEAGRAFAVVAQEMKHLATQVEQSSGQISKTLASLTSQVETLTEQCAASAENAVKVQRDSQQIGAIMDRVGQSVGSIGQKAEEIATGAEKIDQKTSSIVKGIEELNDGISQTATAIDNASQRIQVLIGGNEQLLELAANSGAETEDVLFINKVKQAAREIEGVFEAAITRGEVTLDELFDEKYEPLSGTNPVQVMTKFTLLTDRYLPDIQEPVASSHPKIAFCAAIDRNGYIPTHNLKFSQPQGGDPVWNTANCRNRRIFDDRVGLAAGRNTKPFLLQLYRRDMGGGKSVMMKDLSVPITVRGRHWGGFRMGYRLTE